MIGAHIAGIPVEETLLGLAPIGVVGVAVAVATARARLAAAWARVRRALHRPVAPR